MEIPNKINESDIQRKRDTLAQVSELKQLTQVETSSKAQIAIDPEQSKQQDLDTLSLIDYRLKYGDNPNAGTEYIANKTKGLKAQYVKEQQQDLADSRTILESVGDAALGAAGTVIDTVGGAVGSTLLVEADPLEFVGEGLTHLPEKVADYIGVGDKFKDSVDYYKQLADEAKEGVNEFLEEQGIVLPDSTEIVKEDPDSFYEAAMKDAAGKVYETSSAFTKWVRDFQSDSYKAKTDIRHEQNQEYAANLTNELGEDASTVEHLWKNVSISGNAMWNLAQDPGALGTELFTQLPTLAIAGKSSQVFSGRAARQKTKEILDPIINEKLPHSNMKELIGNALVANSKELIKVKELAGAQAAVITSGALEGVSAASEAYNSIIDTPIEQLEKVSAEYRSLALEMNPIDARQHLAVKQAYGAGMSVGILAAGISKVSGASDAINRISGVTKRNTGVIPKSTELAADAFREGVEEYAQSYVGAVITGDIKKEHVDPTLDVQKEAAIQAGEGALTGAATSGVASVPSLIKTGSDSVGKTVKKLNKKAERVESIKQSGITPNDVNVESPTFDLDVSMRGIEARNKVEDVTPQELADNYNEANQIIADETLKLTQLEVEFEKNPSKVLAKEIKDKEDSLLKAVDSTARMEARLISIKDSMQSGKESTPEQAAERTLNNIQTSPDSVSIEQAELLIENGSLSPEQTAQVESHIQYIKDSKTLAEVNSDVLSGGKGFVGIKQYMRNISSAIAANRPERAQDALGKLKTFAVRHAQKSRDFTEAYTIALNPEATPQELARLQEINALYPPTKEAVAKGNLVRIHKNTPSYIIETIGTEANALQSAVILAENNLAGTFTETTTTEEVQDVQDTTEEVESVPEVTETTETESETSVSQEQEQVTERPTEIEEVVPREDTPLVSKQAVVSEESSEVKDAQTEPVDVEETNVLEDVLGTQETLTEDTGEFEAATDPKSRLAEFKTENPIKKYFRPTNKSGVTSNPLLNVANFMQKFGTNIGGFISRYTGNKDVKANQVALGQAVLKHHEDFELELGNVFKHNPKAYGTRDMVQHLVGEDGNIKQPIIDAMSVATYNWVATRSGETLFNSNEDIRKILDLDITDIITPSMEEYLRDGGFRGNISAEIGRSVVKSLGLSTITNAPGNMKQQLEISLGSLAVATMAKQGLIVESKIPSNEVFTDVENKYETIDKVVVASVKGEEFNEVHPIIQGFIDSVKDTDQMLTKMFKVEDFRKGATTEPIKQVVKKVRGTNQDVPEEVRDTIRKHQELKHYLKREQVEVFLSLPVEVQREMLGYTFDMKSVHEKRKNAVEGANRAINASINHMNDFLVENNNDEPFYFTHDVTKNGRLLLDSTTLNPQGDKLHRHLIKIAGQESTIDLRSEDSTQLQSFLIAFAQGMGIDVDKQLQADSLKEVNELINKPVIVNAIKAINDVNMEGRDAAILAGVKKGGEKTWSLDALVAYAAYVKAALDGSDLFTHDLMVEADGITNGPAIATIQFGVGANKEDKVVRLKKVGVNEIGDTQEFGEYISQADSRDNYETITLELNDKIKGFSGKAFKLGNLTQFLLGDLTIVDDGSGEITKINRNISKNPLMTTIYGAGAQSIKDSIGKATVDAMYEFIEKNVDNPKELGKLGKHLNDTFGLSIKPSDFKKPLEFELSTQLEATVIKQVGDVFGIAMLEAIDEQYGQFKQGTVVINEALGRVAETFQKMYEHAVEKKTKELVQQGILAANTKGEAFETLPQKELDKILTDLIESQPIIHSTFSTKTGNVNEGIYVGKTKSTRNDSTAYNTRQDYKNGTTVNTQGKTTEYVTGGASPVVLAVQGIDAATMMKHLKDNSSFNVYDAIITGVDKVESHTNNINKHFYEINKEYSIAVEAQKAYQRAELAAQKYDRDNGTTFRTIFSVDSTRGFGENEVIVNIKQELADNAQTTDEARLNTIGLMGSVGQYGWENSSYEVPNTEKPESLIDRSLGNTPDAVDGKNATESEIEVNKMTATEVFDSLGKLGNKKEDKEHSEFLRSSVNTLKTQLLKPLTLHLGNILKHKDAKGNDTLANVQGSDIYMYTQMFGGQPNSTAILNAGLRMSAQEAFAHELWHAVSRHGIEGNERAKKELELRWKQAKEVITPFDLMDDPSLGENSPEYTQAKESWDYIFTARVVKTTYVTDPVTGQKDTKHYSNHLHEFAAYSMTNAKFISALQQVPVDTKVKGNVRQDDGSFLNSIYNKLLDFLGGIVDKLSTHLTNTKGLGSDVAVQELVKQLANIEAQNKNTILSTIDTSTKAAGKLAGMLSGTVKAITKPITLIANSKVVKDAKSPFIRLPGRIIRLRNENDAVKSVYNALNETRQNLQSEKEGFVGQVVTEAQGLTEEYKDVHTLSRMKTKLIDGAVVETENEVVKVLNKAFGNTVLTEHQSKSITKAFLKTDLSSLNLNQTQLIDLLDNPTRLPSLIKNIETKLATDPNVNHYILQAKALGHHMATGRVTSENLNYNATQIVRLFGTAAVRKNAPTNTIKLVDQLTTMYALQDTDSTYKITLSELVKSEQVKDNENGMTYLQAFHNTQKEVDLKEIFTGSETNVVKGHIREEYDPNIQAVLLTEADGALYEARGWTKGTELFKDPADPTAAPLYLYTDRSGGQTHTITGIVSLTSKQARGTDTVKIRQTYGDSTPIYGGMQDATRIHAVKSRNFNNSLIGAQSFVASKAPSQMAPLFDLNGNTIGYRYLMNDKAKDNILDRNNDAIRILSSGAANTVNKVNSQELNKRAIESLHNQFITKPDSNYIQFGPASTDPEIRELYRLMPKEAKEDIQRVWNSDTMFVDKKVLTTMFGYRKFSIADALAKEKQDQHMLLQWFGFVLDFIGKPFNVKAEQVARSTGRAWQEFISTAKDFIVIKSGIVTAANTVSNGVQLFTEGVSLINILKHQKEAVVELAKYRDQRSELFELEKMVELGVQSSQLNKQKARIAELQAELTANPITDIVNDGLLQTIVEDVSLVDDQFTLVGKGKALLDKHVYTKVPGYVREAANEVFQTKESFLYKKMAQSAQLSDFMARYALYKHTTMQKDASKRLSRSDAANNAIATFVNYDLPTHRLIQYGNDMGFLWFTKYYIRIQKILLSNLVREPLRVLSVILGDYLSGDSFANMYDSTITPDNIDNRVRLPEFNIVGNLALAKVL